MQQNLHFLIIDADINIVELYVRLLSQSGHKTTVLPPTPALYEQIALIKPDCILCDLLMAGLDTLNLFINLRENEDIKPPIFIIVTAKLYEFDRRRAFKLGVDGYLTKPINPNTFVDDILAIVNGTIELQFWGTRGTLPVPGKQSVRYGGNTNCVSVQIAKKYFFIFDAGTGIKELSNDLIRRNQFPINAKIFISHPHYDHINGLPFFAPLYIQGNEFEILGASHGDVGIEKIICDQMDSLYFPVTTKQFAANLSFRNLNEEQLIIGEVTINMIALNHPGRCLGFRVMFKEKSFCYVTDNEIYLESSPYYSQFEVDRLISFIKECDVLIIDATYSDADYAKKIGWGHSSVSRVVDIADKASVKLLCLYHHDPDQIDTDIDAKLALARAVLESRQSKTRCIAPHEGKIITI